MSQIPEIRPEQSLELLKELHILTRDGKLNQDSRRKLKQVYHLYQFIEPLLVEVMAARGDLTLVDHGAGKSYLGFILYDLFLKAHERVHAIADEDLERENDEKTSAVHFVRFDLTPAMVVAAKDGAAIGVGIDHPNYRYAVEPVAPAVRDALVADLA